MKTSKMNQLKQSEICRIKAAVLEIMESVNFIVDEDVKFEPAAEPESLQMSFSKTRTSVGELNNIQNELGDDFDVIISAGDKKFLNVTIVGHENAFIRMLGKKVSYLNERDDQDLPDELNEPVGDDESADDSHADGQDNLNFVD